RSRARHGSRVWRARRDRRRCERSLHQRDHPLASRAGEILIVPVDGDRKVERLLIVRLSAMGDVIHTLPAAQALRGAFPDAMIGWAIEERWAELLCAPGTPR